MSFTHKSTEGKRMPDSEAKKAWMQNNSTKITIKFMNKGDGDILAFLDERPKATVIKQALRMLMEQEGFSYVPQEADERDE